MDFAMEKDEYVVGRSRKCDIVVKGPMISSRHARFCRGERDSAVGEGVASFVVSVIDESANGTYVNGARLERGVPRRLHTGDEVTLVFEEVQFCARGSRRGEKEGLPTPAWVFRSSASHVEEEAPSLRPTPVGGSGSPPKGLDLTRARSRRTGARRPNGAVRGGSLSGVGVSVPDALREVLRRASTNVVHAEYELHECLGEGSFAKVFRAVDRRTGQTYAIKVLQKQRGKLRGANVKAALKEAELLAQLSHPNIVRLHEAIDTKEALLLIMEFVKGGELFHRIVKRGAYDEERAKHLMRRLLLSVEFMHRRGIVHRDLKPENILLPDPVGDPTKIKVADFGVAKNFSTGDPMKTFCGSPQYFAPEVLARKSRSSAGAATAYTQAADMWSVGVIMYVVLSATPPFSEEDLERQGARVSFEFPDEEWAGVSDAALDLIIHLMEVDPSKRLTAQEALRHPWLAGIRVEEEAEEDWKASLESSSVKDVPSLSFPFSEDLPNSEENPKPMQAAAPAAHPSIPSAALAATLPSLEPVVKANPAQMSIDTQQGASQVEPLATAGSKRPRNGRQTRSSRRRMN